MSTEICIYRFFFYIISCYWIRAIKGKKPVLIFPMVPLGFVLAYQYDMGYGTLIHRMKGKSLINQNLNFWFIFRFKDPVLPTLPELPLTNISVPSYIMICWSHLKQLTGANCQMFRNFVRCLLNAVIIKN